MSALDACAGCGVAFNGNGVVYLQGKKLYHLPCRGARVAGDVVERGARELGRRMLDELTSRRD